MRGILATVFTMTVFVAAAGDIEQSHRQALEGRDIYWKCLAEEYAQVADTHMTSQDFALYIGGVCPSERQKFTVTLVDYLAMKFPSIDATARDYGDAPTMRWRLVQKDISLYIHQANIAAASTI